MPHVRAKDQIVDAFSLPRVQLEKAIARAAELRLTKSGYYRYALAKDQGLSEEDAMALGEHLGQARAVQASKEKVAYWKSKRARDRALRKPQEKPSAG